MINVWSFFIDVNSQRLDYVDAQIRAGLAYNVMPSEKVPDKIIKKIDEFFVKPSNYFRKKSQDFLMGKIDVVNFVVKDLLDLARRKYLS
jgi:hypothetical protein